LWKPPVSSEISKDTGTSKGAAHFSITTLSNVTACEVDWLWEPYLANGMLAMMSGDPGIGKTFVALAISAALTLGNTPYTNKPCVPANVLYLTVENSPEHVLRPRFDLLGGNPSLFHVIDGSIRLSEISSLSKAIQQTKARLMVVDPIQSFLGSDVDTHRANETRPIMDDLSRLAKDHECCILLLRHLSKASTGRAIYRGQGSIDFTGAVRTELLAGCSSHDPKQYALVHEKSNLGPKGPSLGYTLGAKGFSWTGESTLKAIDLLSPESGGKAGEALTEAKDFLLSALAQGPRIGTEVIAEAQQEGISTMTLKRAKKELKVVSKKLGLSEGWKWFLSEGSHATPITENMIPFAHSKEINIVGNK
jgi:RecA-family ATPase